MLIAVGLAGTGRLIRDYITSPAECRGSRCTVRLGSTRVHHRERQGDEEVTEGTARLNGIFDLGV